jgi:hypothetical protein
MSDTPTKGPAAADTPHQFKFLVDLNVINHLGVGLYSSTPAALTELVANAWDADATRVDLSVDAATHRITIEDDGHGMSAADINGKFLNVGYSRRRESKNKEKSESGKRRVMGRKGIGKLSMFALAKDIEVATQTTGGELLGFKIDVPVFKAGLEKRVTTPLKEYTPSPFKKGRGTRLDLRDVLPSLRTTESYLRVKLARRFSVLGAAAGFTVTLNGREITRQDRGFYEHVQFLWVFDEQSELETKKLTPALAALPPSPGAPPQACVERLANEIEVEGKTYQVTGYIASVHQPKQLGSKEDTANIISIFANGRVFAEDVLPDASSAMYYQNYLVGEIHADFLDDDDVDRATASREAIKKDDAKYQALMQFLRARLMEVGAKWDEWRTDLGLDRKDPLNTTILDWIDSLDDSRDQRIATRLMTSIKNAVVHPDDAKNEAAKKVLYRGAIVGFEKLRLTKRLDRLAAVTDVLGVEFAAIFASIQEVEEAAYADITRQRLEVIKKFASIATDPSALEKVAQKYLFKHLWLLDPGWDRVTGRADLELTLTNYLKRVQPDSTGARLDISYRASSGRHVVVELKRPAITNLNYFNLYEQATKYKDAVEAYYREKEPNKPTPPLDIYLLVARTPAGFDETKRRSLAEVSARIVTYDQLINDAKNSYQQYLDVAKATGGLESILGKLG